MTPMRERLARAMRDADPDFLRAADAILDALGPDVYLVDAETFLRGLRSAVRRELAWGGMSEDERAARTDLIDIEARRLLRGRE